MREKTFDAALNVSVKEVVDRAVNGGDYFLRLEEVRRLVALSASTIKRYQARGWFPQHHFIGLKSKAWLASEVKGWMEDRVKGLPLGGAPTGQGAAQ